MPSIVNAYPDLADMLPGTVKILDDIPTMYVPAGTVLFEENVPCQGFPLLLEGEVKVSRSSGDGRSLELYRISPGELCLVSSSCLFRAQPLSARGVTTKTSTLILVGVPLFLQLLADPSFRSAVLGMFAERMADLTALVDSIAFRKLDQRLAAALLGHGSDIVTTHQVLADDLGTVREIVSRLLKRFQNEGWIEISREHIRILDSVALRCHASGIPDTRPPALTKETF